MDGWTCIVCSFLTHSLSVQVYFALCWQEPNSHLLVCIERCIVSLLSGSTDPKHCELIDLTNGGHHSRHTTLQTRPNTDSLANLWPTWDVCTNKNLPQTLLYHHNVSKLYSAHSMTSFVFSSFPLCYQGKNYPWWMEKESMLCFLIFFFAFFHLTIYFGLFVESMIGLWIRQNLSWYLIFWVKSVALSEDVFASVMWNYINVSIKKISSKTPNWRLFLFWVEINHLSEGKERKGSAAAVTWLKLAGGKMNVETGMVVVMVNGRIDHSQTTESIPSAQNKLGLNRHYLTEWTGLWSQIPLSPGCHWCARCQSVEHRHSVQSAAGNP